MKITAHACSVIGGREQNQDSYLVDESKGLYAVADGIGGGVKGDVASRMAVEGLQRINPEFGSLRPTVEQLQKEILEESIRTLGEAMMGTTLTALRIRENVVTMAHVGDSHCYLIENGVLRLMNQDHESFDENVGGTVLTSYLGVPPDLVDLVIQEESFAVVPGQRLLLCSDGLYRQVEETRIGILARECADDPQKLVETLCHEGSMAEYSDNITVVLVTIG